MPIIQIKAHEAQCKFVIMRCRYAAWGCPWTGKKKDIAHHEDDECEFRSGLGTMVEYYRQSESRINHNLQQHHMQLHASSQMLALQSRQIVSLRTSRNAGNVLDVLQLAYQCSCFPGRFLATKESWGRMITCQLSQRIIGNQLLLM